MKQTFITLNNGLRMPQFGLGVFLINGDEETRKTCLEAISLGYRHIDTAHAYQNERGVGQAIRECGVPREKLWITSKLWPSEYGEGKTMVGIDKMLSRLGTDYIDLLLLHQQFGDYLGAWRDMEKAVAAGKVRSIGLSNFESSRLEEVLDVAYRVRNRDTVAIHEVNDGLMLVRLHLEDINVRDKVVGGVVRHEDADVPRSAGNG